MAIGAALAGLTVGQKLLGGLGVAALGSGYAKDLVSMILGAGAGKAELGLQEKQLAAQIEAMKLANAENRRQADMYMGMLTDEKGEKRKENRKDRQMQMMMMLVQAMAQLRQQRIESAQRAKQQLPPMSISSLLRG